MPNGQQAGQFSVRGHPHLTISLVIYKVGLLDFADHYKNIKDQVAYDHLHKDWCGQMIEAFQEMFIPASYGSVAKIIAFYF